MSSMRELQLAKSKLISIMLRNLRNTKQHKVSFLKHLEDSWSWLRIIQIFKQIKVLETLEYSLKAQKTELLLKEWITTQQLKYSILRSESSQIQSSQRSLTSREQTSLKRLREPKSHQLWNSKLKITYYSPLSRGDFFIHIQNQKNLNLISGFFFYYFNISNLHVQPLSDRIHIESKTRIAQSVLF